VSAVIDAAWRAAAYCLLPRVILLSLLPLVLAAGITFGLGWFFWEAALASLRGVLESWALLDMLLRWIEELGGTNLKAVLVPLIVVFLAAPVTVVLSLLLVAVFITPAAARLVVARRFAGMQALRGASWWHAGLYSLGHTALALIALVVSIPLWLIPPLFLVLPPLIWGWLTYRVLSFDVIAETASAEERRSLLREHRGPLFAMGVAAGYMGAAPSLLWAASAATVIFAPIVLPLAVWLYTVVFVFSALWFAHYLLAALAQQRAVASVPVPTAAASFQPAATAALPEL
jgi:Etoposide-induced protein 2.4 (EI24)